MTPLDLRWAKKTKHCRALRSIFDETYLLISVPEDSEVEQPTRKVRSKTKTHKTSSKSVKSRKDRGLSH